MASRQTFLKSPVTEGDNDMRKLPVALAVASALSGVLLAHALAAPPAHADQNGYLSCLSNVGINPTTKVEVMQLVGIGGAANFAIRQNHVSPGIEAQAVANRWNVSLDTGGAIVQCAMQNNL
jgi:hypothetical protein